MTDEQRIEKLKWALPIVLNAYDVMNSLTLAWGQQPRLKITSNYLITKEIELELTNDNPDLKLIEELIESLGEDAPEFKEITDKIEKELERENKI